MLLAETAVCYMLEYTIIPAHLKPSFVLEGNRMWQSFCEDNSLPLLKTGKVLVAKNKQEVEILHTLYDQAIQNGASVEIVPKSKKSVIMNH